MATAVWRLCGRDGVGFCISFFGATSNGHWCVLVYNTSLYSLLLQDLVQRLWYFLALIAWRISAQRPPRSLLSRKITPLLNPRRKMSGISFVGLFYFISRSLLLM